MKRVPTTVEIPLIAKSLGMTDDQLKEWLRLNVHPETPKKYGWGTREEFDETMRIVKAIDEVVGR